MSVNLGHFELHDQIGQGGMGTVFRAFDPSLNRNVAIKLLDEDLAKDPKFVEDFLREAQNAAAISHPHIVPIYFVGEHEGNFYIVMELLNGRPLSAVLQDGPLPEVAALKIAIDIAEALKAAYTNQMIHGDIKPQNIFVTENHGAKLLDFGLAKLANVEVAVSDGIWGSAYYVSPERVGQKAEDFRSDIYSLGATLFEALIGRPPFEAASIQDLAMKRLNEKAPLLRSLNPNLTKRTEQIVNRMLAKSPMLRYLDYNTLIADLGKAVAALEGKVSADTTEMFRTTGQIPVVVAQQKSPMPLIIMATLSVLLAGGAVTFVVMQRKGAQQTAATGASPTASQPAAVKGPTPLPTPYGSKIKDFRYHNEDAKTVQIVGNFDQWHPEPMVRDSAGTWVVSKELPRTVLIEYQYVVDGIKQPDPGKMNDAVADEDGVLKSVLVIPKTDPTPGIAHHTTTATTSKATPGLPPIPTIGSTEPAVAAAPVTAPTPVASSGINLAALAASRANWPKTLQLTESVSFPAVMDGKIIGAIKAGPGTIVKLVNVDPNYLVIEYQNATQHVPAASTDLSLRLQAAAQSAPAIQPVAAVQPAAATAAAQPAAAPKTGVVFPKISAADFTKVSTPSQPDQPSTGMRAQPSSEGGRDLTGSHTGDWAEYKGVNIAGATSIDVRLADSLHQGAPGSIEVHQGSADGPLLGIVEFINDEPNWSTYKTFSGAISNAQGTQDIYLVFKSGSKNNFCNLLWFQFK